VGYKNYLPPLNSIVRPLKRVKGTERKMNSKKAWLIWSLFLMLLTGCEEFHVDTTFEKNGSGVLRLVVVYSESSKMDVEQCRKVGREYGPKVQWHNVSHEGSSSVNNPSGRDQCTYTYSFNDLDEADNLHKALGFKLDRLSIDNNYFTYKATNRACVNDFDPKVLKSVTWSVKPPKTISSYNAEKVIGDNLIWNLSGSDCYDISVVSALVQPADEATVNKDLLVTEPSKSSPGEKTENQPFDATIVTWTTVGASIATIIATAIAYKESKKKK